MSSSSLKAYCMWLMPLAFFAYQFILRQWPSLTLMEMMRHFHVDAADFGIFSAVYYIGYAGFQIPIALLLNRFSPSFLMAIFMGLAAGGMALLLSTNHWGLAVGARFLIGTGSAIGFLGTSHIISAWFSSQRYGFMIALSFSVGLLGAIYGGQPVSLWIDKHGTFATGMIIAGLGGMIALITLLFLRMPPFTVAPQASKTPFTGESLKFLFKEKSLLILGFSNLLLVGALEGFADVWGVNFLRVAYKLTQTDAAGIVSLIFTGMLIGGPLLVGFSKKWGPFTVISGTGLALASLFVLLLFACSYIDGWMLKIILFIIGMLCCYQVVVFSACQQLVSPAKLGIAVAFLNAVNMFGGTFFHTLIGQVSNFLWDGVIIKGCPYYNPKMLALSLSIIPLSAFIGALLLKGLSLKNK